MTDGERQGLVVNLAAIVQVLEPCDGALVAVELVAECTVHDFFIADEGYLLLNVAGAVVVGEVTVGDAGKVEVLALAVARHFAAAPAVVDGSLATTAAPTYEGATVVAAFYSTSAEAVLEEEGCLAWYLRKKDPKITNNKNNIFS